MNLMSASCRKDRFSVEYNCLSIQGLVNKGGQMNAQLLDWLLEEENCGGFEKWCKNDLRLICV
jgi:hypothetical protein